MARRSLPSRTLAEHALFSQIRMSSLFTCLIFADVCDIAKSTFWARSRTSRSHEMQLSHSFWALHPGKCTLVSGRSVRGCAKGRSDALGIIVIIFRRGVPYVRHPLRIHDIHARSSSWLAISLRSDTLRGCEDRPRLVASKEYNH